MYIYSIYIHIYYTCIYYVWIVCYVYVKIFRFSLCSLNYFLTIFFFNYYMVVWPLVVSNNYILPLFVVQKIKVKSKLCISHKPY